jgi:hypothetical protein
VTSGSQNDRRAAASIGQCCLPSQYARIVQKLGAEAKFLDFKIQNVVASTDVKFPIRLEGLAFSHGMFCSVSASSSGPTPRGLSDNATCLSDRM